MTYLIRIQRVPYEEPHHVNLVWEISNGNTSTKFEYYDNAAALRELAEGLFEFPRHSADVFLYEIGSEYPEDFFAYYFRFRAFTTSRTGSSALQIRFSNNKNLPEKELVEFCIEVEPQELNRLGKLFQEFSKLDQEILLWSTKESRLE